MAGTQKNIGPFLGPKNDPTLYNETALFNAGDLGKYYVTDQSNPYLLVGGAVIGPRQYQLVKLDSGSGTTFGQALVWKDYSTFLVTTVSSNSKRNDFAGANVTGSITAAGSVTSTATAGNYIFMLVGGLAPLLSENGKTPAAGDAIVLGASTAGRFEPIVQGTASNGAAIPLGIRQVGSWLAAKTTAFGGITPTGDYCNCYLYPVFAWGA